MPKYRKSSSSKRSRSKSSVLSKIGKNAEDLTNASIPVIENGVDAVYGTMSSALDLGVKGVKKVTKNLSKTSRKASRSLALDGGRRTRRRRRRHNTRKR